MNIRADFDDAHGGAPFVAMAVLSSEVAEFISQLRNGYDGKIVNSRVGRLVVNGEITSLVAAMEWDYMYNIWHEDDTYRRSFRDIEEDDHRANAPSDIAEGFSAFLPPMAAEQRQRLEELLTAAAGLGNTFAITYWDQKDMCQLEYPFGRGHFVASHFLRDDEGNVIGFDEQYLQSDTLVIPSGFHIPENAFRNCQKIRKIVIEERVSHDAGAFAGCCSLEILEMSAGCIAIEKELCKGCGNLVSVTLPPVVYRIEAEAFAGCGNLTQISIPDTALFVHKMAFEGCSKLPGQILEKAAALSDEKGFREGIRKAERYIQTHGDAGFQFDGTSYPWLFMKKECLETWHEQFDPYFDQPSALTKGKKKYAVYAQKKMAVDLEKYGWKEQKSVSDKVSCLVVDTARIPAIDRIMMKQRAIRDGDQEKAAKLGVNMLEKAVELKQSGHPILILTKKHFESLIAADAFVEEDAAAPKTRKRAAAAKTKK